MSFCSFITSSKCLFDADLLPLFERVSSGAGVVTQQEELQGKLDLLLGAVRLLDIADVDARWRDFVLEAPIAGIRDDLSWIGEPSPSLMERFQQHITKEMAMVNQEDLIPEGMVRGCDG